MTWIVRAPSASCLEVDGKDIFASANLEISGSPAALHGSSPPPAHARDSNPGLWPSDNATFTDTRMQAVIGADHYAISRREALEASLAVGQQGRSVNEIA